MLEDPNASLLAILPSVAPGLLRQIDHVQKIRRYIESELARSKQNPATQTQLELVKKNMEQTVQSSALTHLVPDPDRTLLLAYAFGELYTPALALATSRSMVAQVYGYSGNEAEAVVHRYLFVEPGTEAVFIRIAKDPFQEPELGAVDANSLLQIRSMLAQIGYDMDLGTLEVSKSAIDAQKPESLLIPEIGLFDKGYVCVDLYHWYCSCSEHFDQARRRGPDLAGHNIHDPILANLFRKSPHKKTSPLPVCRHILALLLVMYNWDTLQAESLIHYQVINEE